jgi:putative colanic acid biosysnthesis UDP-glucose lipid carrier transferase
MKRDNSQLQFSKIFVLGVDIILLIAAFNLVNRIDGFGREGQSITLLVMFILTWMVAALSSRAYHFDQFWSIKQILVTTLQAFLLHIGIFLLVMLVIEYRIENFAYFALLLFLSIVLIIHSRLLYKFAFKYFEFGSFENRKVVIVGTGSSGRSLFNFFMNQTPNGYKFLGFFDDHPSDKIPSRFVKGKVEHLKQFCIENDVDEIYIALPKTDEELLYEIKQFADDNVIYLRIAPDFSYVQEEDYQVFMYDTVPIITTRREPLGDGFNALVKRSFDIFFSLSVITFIFPFVYTIIALAIRLDSKGPIIFKQLRPGKKNKLFECYKFRTMRINHETERQATKNDPRITRIGAFLRKTSLDELPQFFNVLIGNMSVVGPRPNLISQLDEYSKLIEKYKIRHFITPGITGYAQVNGYRGETRQTHLMAERVRYDVMYMENWSLMLDLKIIALTVWNMIRGEKNAY